MAFVESRIASGNSLSRLNDMATLITARTTGCVPERVLFMRPYVFISLSIRSQRLRNSRAVNSLAEWQELTSPPPRHSILLVSRYSSLIPRETLQPAAATSQDRRLKLRFSFLGLFVHHPFLIPIDRSVGEAPLQATF